MTDLAAWVVGSLGLVGLITGAVIAASGKRESGVVRLAERLDEHNREDLKEVRRENRELRDKAIESATRIEILEKKT